MKYHSDLLDYGNVAEYAIYHTLSDEIGDIDPQYPMLKYICDRYELNIEQRYWLAFLTGACYCAPTVFYIYNEFPDYENVDVGRLQRWWDGGGRQACVFQSDRKWIRSRNQFVPMFESYRQLLAGRTQEEAFQSELQRTPGKTYNKAYDYFGNVKYFGRFGMFLWMEAVYVVTGFPMRPTSMPWKDSSSQSSRNGLCFAMGYDDLIRGHGYGDEPIVSEDYETIEDDFQDVLNLLHEMRPDSRVDVWNMETTLCAYKKWKLGQLHPERQRNINHYRYIGYYLDRQYEEIVKMSENVRNGVYWDVLWDMRKEMLPAQNLRELGANNREWGEEEMIRRMSRFAFDGELVI